MAHYLFKSEPDDYSFDDLERDGQVRWDCIRNYGARNRLQKCEPDDVVLFYHSGRGPEIVGTARVVSEPYPDPTQFDENSDYFDPKATEEKPRWWAVDIAFSERFAQPVKLSTIKETEALSDLEVLRQARLSVSEVTPAEFETIVGLAE